MSPTPSTATYDDIHIYTIEEIDDQLSILGNLLKHAKKAEVDKILKQANNWLDLRLDLLNI